MCCQALPLLPANSQYPVLLPNTMRCLSQPRLSLLALPCPALPCPALLPCLQNEVVSILQQQAKIEPGFTQLVWQKLEEQNPEFFRSAISTQYSPSAVS